MAKKKTSSKASGGNNAANLVIVESPAKAKTIQKYLRPLETNLGTFDVQASVGHVRDLPSKSRKGMKEAIPGVDLENNFEPSYEVMSDSKKTITELRKKAKAAKTVWFATDLDREGEAISWHLAEALSHDVDSAKRVVFNAITEREIREAFESLEIGHGERPQVERSW